MLDGYIYFNNLSQMVSNGSGQKIDVVKVPIKNKENNEYIFNHALDIYNINYVQSPPRKVNESPTFNTEEKKVRIGYSDALLYGKNYEHTYGFDKAITKNSIGYNNEDSFETNIIAAEDNQSLFKWKTYEYRSGFSIMNVFINNEIQPSNCYSIVSDKAIKFNTINKQKIKLKVYVNDKTNGIEEYSLVDGKIVKLFQSIDLIDDIKIYINNELQQENYKIIDNNLLLFDSIIGIKRYDVISIKIVDKTLVNQYNEYNPLKEV